MVFDPPPGAGVWQPTTPAFLPPLVPWLAQVRPLLLQSPSQFRPGPPPALTSHAYAAELLRVKAELAEEQANRLDASHRMRVQEDAEPLRPAAVTPARALGVPA